MRRFIDKFVHIMDPFHPFPMFWPLCLLMWCMEQTDEWEFAALILAGGFPIMVVLTFLLVPVTAVVMLGFLAVAVVKAPYLLYKKLRKAKT